MRNKHRFKHQPKEGITWPVKLITAWIYPVGGKGATCQACERHPSNYEWRDYIDQLRETASDTVLYNLTNVPWERAIKEQVRDVYRLSRTTLLCEQCMPEWISEAIANPDAVSHIAQAPADAAFVVFMSLNNYEDDGVSYLLSVPAELHTIEEVSVIVKHAVPVPAHEDVPEPEGELAESLRELKREAERRGQQVKFIAHNDPLDHL